MRWLIGIDGKKESLESVLSAQLDDDDDDDDEEDLPKLSKRISSAC